MNRDQRKELSEIAKSLSVHQESALRIREDKSEFYEEELKAHRSDVESIRDDEQEKYDNMPEGLQSGSRGESIQEAIDALDNILSLFDDAESLDAEDDDWADEMFEKIQEIIPELEAV